MMSPVIPAATAGAARHRTWAAVSLAWGWLSTILAVGADNMTIASGDYQGVLRFALATALIAAVLFSFAFLRGSRPVRLCAALGTLPLLFVIAEFLQRYKF